MGTGMYNTESGSMTCWWASIDSVYEVLREDGVSVTSRFTWVDFGEVYDDLKQDLLSKLANCGSQSFKEQIVDALINYAHVLGCKDENKLLDIGIANTVFHHIEETSLGSSDGLNMTPASLDAIISLLKEIDYKDNSNEVESCTVCLEEIQKGAADFKSGAECQGHATSAPGSS
ncbi:Hypothetical predicted protein [Olea europaea subsp. europaea]|uniref:Uncharacterized protein n=1 Tax=Olea europaea subsp. europaea TaxID=158383 RepID=A0A8S0V5P2_OLEEU|nr:Hypothetical predicted protein [Olea europaea subsp. europaea]